MQLDLILARARERGRLIPDLPPDSIIDPIIEQPPEPDPDPMPEWWPRQLVAAGVGPLELQRRGEAYRQSRVDDQARRGRALAARVNAGLDTARGGMWGWDARNGAPVPPPAADAHGFRQEPVDGPEPAEGSRDAN